MDPANAEVTMVWTSSNESIATVDGSGVVTGVAEGAAEITVQISRFSGVVLDSAGSAP
ncbi:MAG: Ig-like domain-containing protein [Intestinimonas sp.]